MNLCTLQSLAARTRNEINRMHQRVLFFQELNSNFLTKSDYFLGTISKDKKTITKLVTIQKELKKEICRTIEDERSHLAWEAENILVQESRRKYFEKYRYTGFNGTTNISEEF